MIAKQQYWNMCIFIPFWCDLWWAIKAALDLHVFLHVSHENIGFFLPVGTSVSSQQITTEDNEKTNGES